MLNITNHLGNANQNHNEISSHTGRMLIIKKTREISVGKDMEKREPLCTVGRDVNW